MHTLLILLFAISLAVSFLLTGMEAGVFALSRLRVRQQMRAGNARAAVLHKYLEKPEDFLWTIVVGNGVANVTAATLGVLAVHGWLHRWTALFLLALAVGGILFYALCELWPKLLFRLYPNRLCMLLVRPFGIVHWLLRPLVGVLAWLARWLLHWTGGRSFTGHLFGNRDELRLVMQESSQGLSSEERVMINRVLDLQNISVQQVAIPLERGVTVSAEATVQEALALCRERGFSRLPVWKLEAGRRKIAGMFSLRSVLFLEDPPTRKTAGEYLKAALYLDHDARLEVALRHMQRTGQRLAVVLGPDRQEIGLLSLEDILKALFGDVRL